MPKKEVYLVIHNVRSVLNVGSMFRTADAAGVAKIYLCGYTPTPEHPKMSKTSLGAEKAVSWEHHIQTGRLLRLLQERGTSILALEQTKRSKDLFKFRPKFPLALVVGNEVRGLSPAILNYCDKAVEIPMCGEKESLNVAVAAGIALYEILYGK
jgi:tRNA G18 (ribose-2'-O)-methylase SpoU